MGWSCVHICSYPARCFSYSCQSSRLSDPQVVLCCGLVIRVVLIVGGCSHITLIIFLSGLGLIKQLLNQQKADRMEPLEQIYAHFQREKHKIPVDMAKKLQLMHDYIQDPTLFDKMADEELEPVRDFFEMELPAVKLLFISIVKSILSPKMYRSFEKNCKIKMEGYFNRWTNAYITFQDRASVTFNTFKKKLRFNLENMLLKVMDHQDLNKTHQGPRSEPEGIEDISSMTLSAVKRSSNKESKSKDSQSLKMEFRYKGLRKFKIKFEHVQAGETFAETIAEMKSELKNVVTSTDDKINQYKNLTEMMLKEYRLHYESKGVVFRVHKKEAKIHIEVFMSGHFWDVGTLIEFMLTQKQWNKKVKEEKISYEECCLIERRFRCSNLLLSDRRTLSKVNFYKIGVNQYYIEEELVPSMSTLKIATIAEMNTVMILEILGPKIAKITIESTFNAKGFCRQSDSRSMLIQYFSDIAFINQRYSYLKEKGRLSHNLQMNKFYQDKSKQSSNITVGNISLYKGTEEKPEHKQELNQMFYSVTSKNSFNEEVAHSMKVFCHGVEEEQFHDVYGNEWEGYEEDQESDSSNKDNSGEREEAQREVEQQISMKKIKKREDSIREVGERKKGDKREKECRVEMCAKLMGSVKPIDPTSKIKMEYIKCLRDRVYEKSYLKYRFSDEPIPVAEGRVPWYDPSLLLTAGTEYMVSPDDELFFINEKLIQSQTDSLRFIVKQVGANLISGKSILNVSLPVDIFQSRSLLERCGAVFACAPKYLKPIADADVLTQMRAMVGYLMSIPPLELVMEKPFNPILGETFQAHIDGIPIYYEQTSHHPPISAYFMKCEEFTLYGNLLAVANINLNSASGGNASRMNIVMRNGNHFQLSFPPVEISGLIYGRRKYGLKNKAYIVNQAHRLFGELSIGKESKGVYEREREEKLSKGEVLGGIFKVSEKFIAAFDKETDLLNYSGIKKAEVEERLSVITGKWFEKIFVDGKQVNKDMTAPEVKYLEECLPSDSNLRLDLMMHRIGDLALSQKEKEILETIQRNDRKLRDKNNKTR